MNSFCTSSDPRTMLDLATSDELHDKRNLCLPHFKFLFTQTLYIHLVLLEEISRMPHGVAITELHHHHGKFHVAPVVIKLLPHTEVLSLRWYRFVTTSGHSIRKLVDHCHSNVSIIDLIIYPNKRT